MGSLASERYYDIYAIARRFNILIIEDDAYFYEQHSVRERTVICGSSPKRRKENVDASEEDLPGLRLGPSFLSLDGDGRVLRLDSFSKFLAPGFRLGWVTGPQPLIDKYS